MKTIVGFLVMGFASVGVVMIAACGAAPPPGGNPTPGGVNTVALAARTCTPASKPAGAAGASCTLHLKDGDYCSDMTGSVGSNPEQSKKQCDMMKGDYATKPCKADGVVARCLVQCGKDVEAVNTYYFGTADAYKDACERQHGTLQ